MSRLGDTTAMTIAKAAYILTLKAFEILCIPLNLAHEHTALRNTTSGPLPLSP